MYGVPRGAQGGSWNQNAKGEGLSTSPKPHCTKCQEMEQRGANHVASISTWGKPQHGHRCSKPRRTGKPSVAWLPGISGCGHLNGLVKPPCSDSLQRAPTAFPQSESQKGELYPGKDAWVLNNAGTTFLPPTTYPRCTNLPVCKCNVDKHAYKLHAK